MFVIKLVKNLLKPTVVIKYVFNVKISFIVTEGKYFVQCAFLSSGLPSLLITCLTRLLMVLEMMMIDYWSSAYHQPTYPHWGHKNIGFLNH